jgi:uncharacterized protein
MLAGMKAAALEPDAIRVASARELGPDLRGVVTYDRRMSEAAEAAGLVVVAPR